ncbi:conserved hypothetical protein [Sphingobacterium sp. PM2-P1-29]|jgi:hypothetical protein|uniref:IS66 family insertion sequence element accessory protein TnpA n=1 Tax=Sphingobacterium faecium TaxID=34087 RepID=UPI0004E5F6A6|nr:conserved hypothetical protein [Sphingobacterium sp. PM2-P1-29]
MSTEEKREYMKLMVSEWQQSGKSKKQYCRENDLNYAKFQYWIKRSKEESMDMGHFVELKESTRDCSVEIIYPNGVRLKVEADLIFVSQLIRL